MSKLIVDTVENTAGTFTAAIDSLGSSTTYGDVGTYVIGYEDVGQTTENTTIAGSSLFPGGFRGISGDLAVDAGATGYYTRGGTALSGTWRRMYRANTGGNDYRLGLHVRIS